MAKTTQDGDLFISHSAADSTAANLLLDWLKANLEQIVDIHAFCSSRSGDLNPGEPWFDQIAKKLRQCKIGILLATPNSVHRPWVLYEAGALAGHGKRHIPICAGGLRKTDLVSPLNSFQAIEYSNSAERSLLLQTIATDFGVHKPTIATFLRQITEAPDIDAAIPKPASSLVSNLPSAGQKGEVATPSIDSLLWGLWRNPDRWCSVIYTCRSTFTAEPCPGDHQEHPPLAKALRSHIPVDEFRTVGLVLHVHPLSQESDLLADGLICSKHAHDLLKLDGRVRTTGQGRPDFLDRDWLIIGENNLSDPLLRIMQPYLPWIYRVKYVQDAHQAQTRPRTEVEIEQVSSPLNPRSEHADAPFLRAGSSMIAFFPNPFNINRDILILFGCHRSGQYGLESALGTVTLKRSLMLLRERLRAAGHVHVAAQVIIHGTASGNANHNPSSYKTQIFENRAGDRDPFWLVPLSSHKEQALPTGDVNCENPTEMHDLSLLVLIDKSEQHRIRDAVRPSLDDLGLYWEDNQNSIGFHVTLFEFYTHRIPDRELMQELDVLANAVNDKLASSDCVPKKIVVRVRQLEVLSNSLVAYADFLGPDEEPIGWMGDVRQWCETIVSDLRTSGLDAQNSLMNILKVPFPVHVTLCRFPRALNGVEQKRLQALVADSRRREFIRFPIENVTLMIGRKTPYRDTKTVGTIPLRRAD